MRLTVWNLSFGLTSTTTTSTTTSLNVNHPIQFNHWWLIESMVEWFTQVNHGRSLTLSLTESVSDWFRINQIYKDERESELVHFQFHFPCHSCFSSIISDQPRYSYWFIGWMMEFVSTELRGYWILTTLNFNHFEHWWHFNHMRPVTDWLSESQL